MRTIQLNLYSFGELDKDARKKAIERYHDVNLVYEWWDAVFDDFISLAGYLGITVEKNTINFQGFCFQGNGSGFYAEVDLAQLADSIAGEGWKEYAPQENLQLTPPAIDKRVWELVTKGKFDLKPCIIRKSKVYEVYADLGYNILEERGGHIRIYTELYGLERWLEKVGQTLNKFLFRLLENEYDRLSGDEAIAETLEVNEYLFTADGRTAERLDKLSIQQTANTEP